MKNYFFKSSLLLFLLFSGLTLYPQTTSAQSETEDVIYLKNGSILRGNILEIRNDGTVKIEIAGGSIFVVQMDEVDRITEEALLSRNYYKSSGYINHTGIDILSGTGTNTAYVQMMNGYRFNPNFAAGIGIGYIPYRDPLNLIPLYLEFNVNLVEANISPYFFLKTGYNFSMHSDDNYPVEDHRGGLMINPGMGIQFNSSNGFRWYMNAGFNVNNARFVEEEFGEATIETDLSYRRMTVGLGFSF